MLTRIESRPFQTALMIAFRITVNLHFPGKCIRDRQVGKAWLLLSRELPFNWGGDKYSQTKEANQRKKTSQLVGFEMVLAFVAWQTGMGDSRAPRGPARPPLSVHIVSLSSPARLRVKAFASALGEMGCSCLNLFKKYPENAMINHPPNKIKLDPLDPFLVSDTSAILKAHPGLSRTEEGLTTQAFVPSDVSGSPRASHLTALSLGFSTHKDGILMLPISWGR